MKKRTKDITFMQKMLPSPGIVDYKERVQQRRSRLDAREKKRKK